MGTLSAARGGGQCGLCLPRPSPCGGSHIEAHFSLFTAALSSADGVPLQRVPSLQHPLGAGDRGSRGTCHWLWFSQAGRRGRALLSHHSRWASVFVFNKITPSRGGGSSAPCVQRWGREQRGCRAHLPPGGGSCGGCTPRDPRPWAPCEPLGWQRRDSLMCKASHPLPSTAARPAERSRMEPS